MNSMTKILRGYKNIFTKSFVSVIIPILLFLLVVLGLSFLIVLPLWTLATTDKALYSNVVLISTGSLLTLFLIYKTVYNIVKNGFRIFCISKLWPITKKILKFFGVSLIILTAINMYSYSIIIGIITSVIVLIILGFFKFAFKK